MTNTEFLNKFDVGEKFSEDELREIGWGESPDGSKYVDEEEGEDHRWQREMTTIFSVDGRTFALNWMKGLTECQESDYESQPYEVKKEEYQKTITVTKWARVKK